MDDNLGRDDIIFSKKTLYIVRNTVNWNSFAEQCRALQNIAEHFLRQSTAEHYLRVVLEESC